jgi:hypothetical protein
MVKVSFDLTGCDRHTQGIKELIKQVAKDCYRHTGRGEAEIRYPGEYCFFLDSGHPPAADSGMTIQLTVSSSIALH